MPTASESAPELCGEVQPSFPAAAGLFAADFFETAFLTGRLGSAASAVECANALTVAKRARQATPPAARVSFSFMPSRRATLVPWGQRSNKTVIPSEQRERGISCRPARSLAPLG